MENMKMLALAMVMEDVDHVQNNMFTYGGNEYLVLTDDERYEEATEYIKETLWTFNAEFLASMSGLPEEVFTALTGKYESGNEAILQLVEKTCGLEKFVDEAISVDGYGHFLNPYDGEEEEIMVDGTWYYIYRQN